MLKIGLYEKKFDSSEPIGGKTHFSESMNKVKLGANSFVLTMPKNEIGENSESSTISNDNIQRPSIFWPSSTCSFFSEKSVLNFVEMFLSSIFSNSFLQMVENDALSTFSPLNRA